MIILDKYRFAIEIRLDKPGVYLFPNASASGKSYLCRTLRELSPYERVDSMTFYDIQKIDVGRFFDRGSSDLILLDRYDMYPGKFLKEILEFAKTGIVLVDSKVYAFPFQVMSCGIYLYVNKLVVL